MGLGDGCAGFVGEGAPRRRLSTAPEAGGPIGARLGMERVAARRLSLGAALQEKKRRLSCREGVHFPGRRGHYPPFDPQRAPATL